MTSLPPLGCLPAARTLFGSTRQSGCVAHLNTDAQGFNQKLNSTAIQLQKRLPGLKLAVFDIFKPLYDAVKSPSDYGIQPSKFLQRRPELGAIFMIQFSHYSFLQVLKKQPEVVAVQGQLGKLYSCAVQDHHEAVATQPKMYFGMGYILLRQLISFLPIQYSYKASA